MSVRDNANCSIQSYDNNDKYSDKKILLDNDEKEIDFIESANKQDNNIRVNKEENCYENDDNELDKLINFMPINSINADNNLTFNSYDKSKTKLIYFCDILISVIIFGPICGIYW